MMPLGDHFYNVLVNEQTDVTVARRTAPHKLSSLNEKWLTSVLDIKILGMKKKERKKMKYPPWAAKHIMGKIRTHHINVNPIFNIKLKCYFSLSQNEAEFNWWKVGSGWNQTSLRTFIQLDGPQGGMLSCCRHSDVGKNVLFISKFRWRRDSLPLKVNEINPGRQSHKQQCEWKVGQSLTQERVISKRFCGLVQSQNRTW